MDDGLSREVEWCVCKGRSGKGRHVFVRRQKTGDALKKENKRARRARGGPTRHTAHLVRRPPSTLHAPRPPSHHPKSPPRVTHTAPWLIIATWGTQGRPSRNGTVAPKRARRANVGPRSPARLAGWLAGQTTAAAALMKGLNASGYLPRTQVCETVPVPAQTLHRINQTRPVGPVTLPACLYFGPTAVLQITLLQSPRPHYIAGHRLQATQGTHTCTHICTHLFMARPALRSWLVSHNLQSCGSDAWLDGWLHGSRLDWPD